MRPIEITVGLRVQSPALGSGTCTGRVETRPNENESWARAEVVWDRGGTSWPLVSVLAPAGRPRL